jgi:hypothetical protein
MNNPRILNSTKGYAISRKQALRAIENCVAAWDVPNKSIRDLTLAESIAARNIQSANRDPLDYAELPGITFKPPIGAQAAYANEQRLAFEANSFFVKAIQ